MKKNYLRFPFVKGLLSSMALLSAAFAAAQTTETFSFTGSVQTFTVPYCVNALTLDVKGAQGGPNITNTTFGGLGGTAYGVLNVTPGDVLTIYVGGMNGFNGGGARGTSDCTTAWGGFGGGASDIRINGVGLNNRVIVGAGGGGGGGDRSNTCGRGTGGGGGGGYYGGGGGAGYGNTTTPPTGGSQTAGGAAGITQGAGINGNPGVLGIGGNGGGEFASNQGGANQALNGGDGGGLVGANGQAPGTLIYVGHSGAGGSSYVSTALTNTATLAGNRTGNGLVTITYTSNGITAGGTVAPASICSGAIVNLNAISGLTSYTWMPGNIQLQNTTQSPTSNTSYTLIAINAQGCTSQSVFPVTVFSGPPLLSIASSTNQTCLGKTVTLTASGAVSYTWSGGVANGVGFLPSTTNIYTVTGANNCGTTSATQAITVSPLPITAIASLTNICQGYPTTLTAVSAPGNYTWQPGSLPTSMVVVAPLANTIYTVTVSDGTCSGTSTVEVTTKTTPTITTAAATSTICEGESIVLSASGAGVGGTYTWSPGGIVGSSITVTPSSATLYTVSATNSVNCESFANQVVLVTNPLPVQVSASSNVVCAGATVSLTANSASTYTWVGGPSTASYVVNPTASTVYTVLGGNTTNSCIASKTIAITAVVSNVTVSNDMAICVGQSATLIASGANTYAWNGGPTLPSATQVLTPTATVVYTVVANTQSLSVICPTTHTILVTVNNNPTITVAATRTRICRGETNTLTASGASSYTWSGSTNSSSVIVVSPITSTILTINGIDENGCENSIQYQVLVNACTSIADNAIQKQSILIFPNPNKGTFTVKTEVSISVDLINSLGQHLQTLDLNTENNYTAKLNNLSSGIYFLIGENDRGKINQKIIVSH